MYIVRNLNEHYIILIKKKLTDINSVIILKLFCQLSPNCLTNKVESLR